MGQVLEILESESEMAEPAMSQNTSGMAEDFMKKARSMPWHAHKVLVQLSPAGVARSSFEAIKPGPDAVKMATFRDESDSTKVVGRIVPCQAGFRKAIAMRLVGLKHDSPENNTNALYVRRQITVKQISLISHWRHELTFNSYAEDLRSRAENPNFKPTWQQAEFSRFGMAYKQTTSQIHHRELVIQALQEYPNWVPSGSAYEKAGLLARAPTLAR